MVYNFRKCTKERKKQVGGEMGPCSPRQSQGSSKKTSELRWWPREGQTGQGQRQGPEVRKHNSLACCEMLVWSLRSLGLSAFHTRQGLGAQAAVRDAFSRML